MSKKEETMPSIQPSHEEGKKKRKKKKKQEKQDVWIKNPNDERERIREYWLGLTEDERRNLVRLEKDSVLKKMRDTGKHTCSCSVCGRKRNVIETELEMLYDAYHEELENFAKSNMTDSTIPFPLDHSRTESYSSSHSDISDDSDYDSEEEDKFHGLKFHSSNGVLTVADDFIKNDGRKFLELMDQVAERKIQAEDRKHGRGHISDEEDSYDESASEEEDEMTDEQRMAQGRRMFQLFAAKMFEQRVLTAYREKIALERQQKLFEELEAEEREAKEREANKARKNEKKREKARLEKQKREQEKKEEEERKRLEEEAKKLEEEKRRKEREEKERLERLKKEEERKKKEEEERKKREERERKEREKQKLAQERKEKERKEKEEREKKLKSVKSPPPASPPAPPVQVRPLVKVKAPGPSQVKPVSAPLPPRPPTAAHLIATRPRPPPRPPGIPSQPLPAMSQVPMVPLNPPMTQPLTQNPLTQAPMTQASLNPASLNQLPRTMPAPGLLPLRPTLEQQLSGLSMEYGSSALGGEIIERKSSGHGSHFGGSSVWGYQSSPNLPLQPSPLPTSLSSGTLNGTPLPTQLSSSSLNGQGPPGLIQQNQAGINNIWSTPTPGMSQNGGQASSGVWGTFGNKIW